MASLWAYSERGTNVREEAKKEEKRKLPEGIGSLSPLNNKWESIPSSEHAKAEGKVEKQEKWWENGDKTS